MDLFQFRCCLHFLLNFADSLSIEQLTVQKYEQRKENGQGVSLERSRWEWNPNMLNIALKSLNVLFIDNFAGFLDPACMWHLKERSVCRNFLDSIQDSSIRLDKQLIQMLTWRNRCVVSQIENENKPFIRIKISNIKFRMSFGWFKKWESKQNMHKETEIETSKPRRMACFFLRSGFCSSLTHRSNQHSFHCYNMKLWWYFSW